MRSRTNDKILGDIKMASLTKPNEVVVAPFFKNGVTLQFFTLTFPSTVAAKLDTDYTGYPSAPRSPVVVALEAIQQACSIEIIGTVQDLSIGGAGRDMRFAVAAPGGAFGTTKWDGTNSETFAAYLQRLVQAAGTHQNVALASCAVAAITI
jgi:hypothetical protein